VCVAGGGGICAQLSLGNKKAHHVTVDVSKADQCQVPCLTNDTVTQHKLLPEVAEGLQHMGMQINHRAVGERP
jgi:hypothetical protein